MRRQTVGAPDAMHRAHRNARGYGHHGAGPVGRLARRVLKCERDDLFGHLGAERRNARRARLIAQQAIAAFLHEAFLPAPDTGLGFAGAPHDLVRADPVGAQQDDFGAPSVLLRRVAIVDESLQPFAVRRRKGDGDAGAHAPDSHALQVAGIPSGIQMSDLIH